MKKRLLSLTLALCIVLGLLPQITLTAGAAANNDPFGLDVNGTLENPNLEDNPYGTTGWFSLFTKSELVESKTSKDGGRNQYVDRYNTDGSRSREGDFGLGSGYSLIATAPFDPNGTGRKEYIANLVYQDSSNKLYLYVTDTYGTVTDYREVDNSKGFMDEVESYHATSHMAITAGDYDGDGRDTVVVYAVNALELQEFEMSGRNINKVRNVCHIGDVVGRNQLNWVMDDDNDNGSDELRATPSLQMTTADTDKDGRDELVLAASWNDLDDDKYNGNRADWQCSYAAVYDYNDGWGQTWKRVLEANGDATAKGRLRFAGVSVGNVQQGESTVDYPEIIAAGFIDEAGGDGCSISEKQFGLYMFRYDGTNYSVVMQDDRHNFSEFTSGGLYSGDKIQDPMAVTAFAAHGIAEAEYLFVEGETYYYDSGSSKFVYDTKNKYFDDDDDGIGRFIISNGSVQQAVAGNFDGNMEGREQVMFTTMQKYKYGNGHFAKTWRYGYNADRSFYSNDYGWSYYWVSKIAVSLAAADVGKQDGTLAKIKSKSLGYTEPDVMAILEAPPYFSEVNEGDLNNGTTEYGQSKGSGTGSSSSTKVSASAMVGFEYEDGVTGSGGGFETTITNEWTSETAKSTEEEYEITYSNDSGENAVIVYRTPVTTYEYDVRSYTPGSTNSNTLVIGIQGEPTTNMITVDQYNEAADAYGLDQISGTMLATAGSPTSYRSMMPTSKDPKHSWQAKSSSTYGGTGTVSQSLSITNSTEESSTYDFTTEFEASGVVFGVKAGGGVGGGFGSGSTTMNSEGTSKTGAVSTRPSDVQNIENYDFTWRFSTWTQTLNQQEIPVLGYLVNNVIAPPSPPQNLAMSEHTDSSMKLTWESGDRPANEYKVYRYNPSNPYNAYTLLGSVNGGAEEDGTYSFYLGGLAPDTTYQYVITGVSLKFGESVYSEVVIGTTLAQSGDSLTFENPANKSALESEVAAFSVNVSNYGGYNQVNYQWQEKLSGAPWKTIDGANASRLSVTATAERANAKYRCIVFGTTSAGDSVPYYSSAATLTVGLADVEPSLSVTGYDSGEGTQTQPYAGLANHTKETSSSNQVTYIVQATAAVGSGDTAAVARVYNVGTEAKPVYVGIVEQDAEGQRITEYYAVTKTVQDGQDVYTAGEKLTYQTVASYTKGDGAYTWPEQVTDNLVEPLSVKIGEKTYHRYIAVQGTFAELGDTTGSTSAQTVQGKLTAVSAVGEQYISRDDATFYPYTDGMTMLPAAAEIPTGFEVTQLYHTSAADGTAVYLVGHTDTDYAYTPAAGAEEPAITTKSSVFRWYEIKAVTVEAGTAYTPAEIVQNVETTLSGTSFTAVSDPTFKVETTKKTEDVVTTSQTDVTGKALSLAVQTTKLGGEDGGLQVAAPNADYTIRMVNQTSGKVLTRSGRTDDKGLSTVAWTAPSAGLYAITVITGSNSSEARFYLAGGASEQEYTLAVSRQTDDNKTNLTAATYGDTLTLRTGKTTITTKEDSTLEATFEAVDDDGLAYYYTVDGGAEQKIGTPQAFAPERAGTYQILSKKDGAVLASTILSIGKKALTVKPIWTGSESGQAPAMLSDITPTAKTLVSGDTLDDVFQVICDLYKADGSQDTEKTGAFSVELHYQTSAAADAFRSKYDATLEKGQILRRQDTYPVSYTVGENGKAEGRYGDTGTLFASGMSIEIGQKLQFLATPKSGFIVDQWTVNDTPISIGDKTYQLSNNNNTLSIADFGVDHLANNMLNIKVTFKSDSHTVSYSVKGEGGNLTAATAENNKVENGGKVAEGATVTFTATPDAGQTVSKWTVNGSDYTWPGGTSLYRENTLTVSAVSGNLTVTVAYEAAGIHHVTTSVESEAGTETAGITVSAKNAATNDAIADLGAVPSGTAITFSVPTSDTMGVKEWQLDKGDGAGYQAIAGSGGSGSVTVYNITGDWSVKAIITTAQTFALTYQVKLGDAIVTDAGIASLAASSRGAALSASPATCAAYIPVDFALTLNDNYRVVSWAGVAANEQDSTKASIASLAAKTIVTVTIAEKPQITVSAEQHGATTVSGVRAGKDIAIDTASTEKHVDYGSGITISAVPQDGYFVSSITVGGVAYSYDSAEKYDPDTVQLSISDVQDTTAVAVVYTEKPVLDFESDADHNITVSAKQGDTALTDGQHIEKYSSDIVLTATPNKGYETAVWTVNGASVTASAVSADKTDETTYTVAGPIAENVTASVTAKTIAQHNLTLSVEQIDQSGNGKHGAIRADVTRKTLNDYTASISDTENAVDGQFYRDSNLMIYAEPDANYRVQTYTWTVNGVSGSGSTLPDLTDVQGDVTVSVRFIKTVAGVTFGPTDPAHTGGYLSAAAVENTNVLGNASSGINLAQNKALNLKATPATGYEVQYWTQNAAPIDGTEGKTDYTYISLGTGESVYLAPVFRQVTYGVTAGADHGSVSIAPALTENQARGGTELTFTATPTDGYAVSYWTVNGLKQDGSAGSSFVWTVPNGKQATPAVSAYEIRAVMARGSYQVNYSAQTGGTVTSPVANGSYVANGAEVTLTAVPATGRHLAHWLVNGAKKTTESNALSLTVTTDTTVQAVFALDAITLDYSLSGRPGKITATVDGNRVASGATVPYGADVVLTVKPSNATDMLASWTVDGSTVAEMTDTEDVAMSYTLQNVTGAQTVAAQLVERPTYTIAATAQEHGAVSIVGDTENTGSITVARNESVTITTEPDEFHSFHHWIMNGVQNDTDGSTLTLSAVKKDYAVEAVFDEAVLLDVYFSIEGSNPNDSTVKVQKGNEVIYPTTDTPASVVGGTTLTFTAQPAADASNNIDMVAKWTVDGTEVTNDNMAALGLAMTDRLSNTLVISKLTKAVHVTAEFVPYVGYAIPSNQSSYTITNVLRVPDDTLPKGEIRKDGTVTFTVTPTQLAGGENGYLSKLLVNGYDCLTATGGNGDVTAVKNANGSFTVTVTNVNADIQTEIVANKLVVEDDVQVPDSLKENEELNTTDKIKTKLETKLTNHASENRAFYEVTLKYYDTTENAWQIVSEHDFPAEGVDVVIPYPAGTDSKDTFTLIHMLTTSGSAGEMEVVKFTKEADGLHFHVNSLSPFAIGWSKYTAPAGGGGGGGAVTASHTINATVGAGGSITPSGKVSVVSGKEQTFTIKPNDGYQVADVLVDGKSVGAVEAYTFKDVSADHTIAVRFVGNDEANCPSKPYTDVDRTQWYHEAVDYAISNGLMSGYDAHTFGPEDALSRAMLAQILYNNAKRPAVTDGSLFTDVANGAWYADAVIWANAKGYVTGYGDGLFGPDDHITREQLAAILWRHAGSPAAEQALTGFADADRISGYASGAMQWAVERGIISGKGNGVLDPTGNATRAEVAAMLMRYLTLSAQ